MLAVATRMDLEVSVSAESTFGAADLDVDVCQAPRIIRAPSQPMSPLAVAVEIKQGWESPESTNRGTVHMKIARDDDCGNRPHACDAAVTDEMAPA